MSKGPGRSTRLQTLDDERRRVPLRPYGALRVAVAYPNRYHVAMSCLGFQWVWELATGLDDVGIERAVADVGPLGTTLETRSPLSAMDVIGFSLAFELDAPNVIGMLEAGGISARAEDRGAHEPLVVVGGSVASINPLPLAPAVDVFCLGAAERLWPQLLERLRQSPSRRALLDELAATEGYFVPSRHLDQSGRPRHRLRRLEKHSLDALPAHLVPASHAVTPHTEYTSRGLVEMSRGCPERCRYCWISYNAGRIEHYRYDAILERLGELSELSSKVGLVATAVGDHPDIVRILQTSVDRGLDVALSSLRIPAVVPEVLEPLVASGARSVTIAPETGTDRLRFALGKPIPRDRILEAVETVFRSGLTSLKMYFIVGLPGEGDEDVLAIADLVRSAHDLASKLVPGHARPGRPWLRAGVGLLVPKPYTPFHGAGMLPRAEASRRLALVQRRLRGLSGFRLDTPSIREAHWQGFLSRAGTVAFPLLTDLARGSTLGSVMTAHRETVRPLLEAHTGDTVPWHFISSAPSSHT